MFAAACAAAVPAATAAEQAMLVLDASGSMWGQIGGKAKIAIAREAIGSMLDGWNGGDLGLMAYGHNRKGDCTDIEVMQPVGPDTASGILERVNTMNPKGMTPITDAVRRAAEQLRYTEHKATVILVSDGEETCNADPCAVASELEAVGVNFTTHVVGFDIQHGSKAHKQLHCLAANTGGRYLEARDAAELNQALGEVAQTAPAKPEQIGNLKPAKGCLLYDADDFKGESLLIGDKGYEDEMPPGWNDRVRSLKCSARSGLYVYNDKAREGDYLMIEDGGERNHLGALASSYIYFGTFAENEDVLDVQP